MHEYIVHVVRKDVREWYMDITIPNQRVRSLLTFNKEDVNIRANIEEPPDRMETWYCHDEASALVLAQHLSILCPTHHVNVYKLAAVAKAVISSSNVVRYTEQGLIPE
jgi:hypothetical protein